MSVGVGLDIGTGDSYPVPLEMSGRQAAGIDRLVDAPGVEAQEIGGFAYPQQISFTTHRSSMYVIPER